MPCGNRHEDAVYHQLAFRLRRLGLRHYAQCEVEVVGSQPAEENAAIAGGAGESHEGNAGIEQPDDPSVKGQALSNPPATVRQASEGGVVQEVLPLPVSEYDDDGDCDCEYCLRQRAGSNALLANPASDGNEQARLDAERAENERLRIVDEVKGVKAVHLDEHLNIIEIEAESTDEEDTEPYGGQGRVWRRHPREKGRPQEEVVRIAGEIIPVDIVACSEAGIASDAYDVELENGEDDKDGLARSSEICASCDGTLSVADADRLNELFQDAEHIVFRLIPQLSYEVYKHHVDRLALFREALGAYVLAACQVHTVAQGDAPPLAAVKSTFPALSEAWVDRAYETVRREHPCTVLAAERRHSQSSEPVPDDN
ncbi:hypothetical protein KEM52_004540 [Ascosphaera acerosa]|nr:hypothetical protein KEM52_004540 [Ascosphaera acerosa]